MLSPSANSRVAHQPAVLAPSQLPVGLQRLVAVDKHAPALAAAAAVAGDDGLEGRAAVGGVGGTGQSQDGLVKGAGLQPDGGDAEATGLAQKAERGSGRRDDRHGRLAGIRQSCEVGQGRIVTAGDGDVGSCGVDGRGRQAVGRVPGKDWGG